MSQTQVLLESDSGPPHLRFVACGGSARLKVSESQDGGKTKINKYFHVPETGAGQEQDRSGTGAGQEQDWDQTEVQSAAGRLLRADGSEAEEQRRGGGGFMNGRERRHCADASVIFFCEWEGRTTPGPNAGGVTFYEWEDSEFYCACVIQRIYEWKN